MRRLTLFLFMVMTALVFSSGTFAQTKSDPVVLDMQYFDRLPVMSEGRLKPLASFAQAAHKKISGESGGDSLWLAGILFDPARALLRPAFRIGNQDLLFQMGLEPRKSKLFSLQDLSEGLARTEEQALKLAQTESGKLTKTQQELIELHRSAIYYSGLMNAVSLVLPMNVDVPENFSGRVKGSVEQGPDFFALAPIERDVMEGVKALLDQKGENIETYTDEEKKLASLGLELQVIKQAGSGQCDFNILPTQWQGEEDQWLCPWASVLLGKGSPASARYLDAWRDMAMAYRSGDAAAWKDATENAHTIITEQTAGYKEASVFGMELFYNALRPFWWAMGLYVLAAALSVLAVMRDWAPARALGLLSVFTGVALHGLGLTMRVMILDRPPVGTLYESVLFVSLIVGFCGMLLALKRRDMLVLLAASLSALMLLALAPVFMPKGDSMEMLVAVLNTGFWLSTHVICITIGYGMCMFTSALAHLWLVQRVLDPKEKRQKLFAQINVLSLVALFFTAFGTVLGGIWADQSWGRFWGWDPKENGALLIVLWLVWLQHGKLAGVLGQAGFIAGMAFVSVVVALAWFGVNLLSVGLHSYGFTTGVASGLAAFCTLELIIVGYLWRAGLNVRGK